jgi:hypothetical protein
MHCVGVFDSHFHLFCRLRRTPASEREPVEIKIIDFGLSKVRLLLLFHTLS